MDFDKKAKAIDHVNIFGGIVIQLAGKFIVYKSADELDAAANDLKGRYHCLEIVRRNVLRKPFVDIDAKLSDDSLGAVCEKLTELFNGNDYKIYNTGRGHHIIIEGVQIGYTEHMAKLLIAKQEINEFVDSGVLHSLRLAGTRKPNAPCKSVQPGAKLSDMLVQPFGSPVDPNGIVLDKKQFDGEITNDFEKLFSSVISDKFDTFAFRDNGSNGFNFSRMQPAHCKICDTLHEKENAFMMFIGKNKYRAHCYRNVSKFIEFNADGLPEYSDSYPGAFEPCTAELYESAPLHMGGEGCKSLTGNYIDASACGLGKTTALYSNIDKNANILLISYRKTFTAKMAADYNLVQMPPTGVIEYRRGAGMRLVCQIDSLHRISVPGSESLDILILDEIHGIGRQLFGDLSNVKIRDSIARLSVVMKLAKRVVALDAQANDQDRKILEAATGKTFQLIKNTYKPNSGKNIFRYLNFDYLEAELLRYIKTRPTGEKFIIFTHTKDAEFHSVEYFARRLQEMGLSVKYYHSGTDQVKREEDFKNAENAFSSVDCVIYNVTLEAGVSIKNDSFKRLFCFSSQLGACEATFQALHRFRAIETIHYASRTLFGRQKYPTNVGAVESALKKYISGALGDSEKIQLFGDINTKNTPLTLEDLNSWIGQFWLHTVLEGFRSKSHFDNRLFAYLEQTGYTIADIAGDKKKEVTQKIAECDEFLQKSPAQRIYDANDITPNQANEYLEKSSNKTQEIMLSIEKALLIQRLDIEADKLKIEDIENFKNLTSQWYRYKSLISGFEIHETFKLSANASHKEAHNKLNDLINKLGFGDLNGELKSVSGKDFKNAVDLHKEPIQSFNENFNYLFGGFGSFKAPTMKEVTPKGTSAMICKALNILYGLNLENSDKRNAVRGVYEITPEKWPASQLEGVKQCFNSHKKKMQNDIKMKESPNSQIGDISDIYDEDPRKNENDEINDFLNSL